MGRKGRGCSKGVSVCLRYYDDLWLKSAPVKRASFMLLLSRNPLRYSTTAIGILLFSDKAELLAICSGSKDKRTQ